MQGPPRVLLRVAPESPLALAAAEAISADAEARKSASATPEPEPDTELLRTACASGDFGAAELRALQRLRARRAESAGGRRGAAGGGGAPGVSALVRASSAAPRVGLPGEALGGRALAAPAGVVAGGGASADADDARERWRDEMRGRQSHREYASLVRSVRTREDAAAAAAGFRLHSQHLSVGLSLLLTLVSAVLLGFFAGRAIFGRDRTAAALALAAFCGIALFAIEAVLTISRLSRVDAREAAAARRPGALAAPAPAAPAARRADPDGARAAVLALERELAREAVDK